MNELNKNIYEASIINGWGVESLVNGNLEMALDYFTIALNLDPNNNKIKANLLETKIYINNNYEEILSDYNNLNLKYSIPELKIKTFISVLAYLTNLFEYSSHISHDVLKFLRENNLNEDKNLQFIRSYSSLIFELNPTINKLKYKEIIIIGDSHSLDFNNKIIEIDGTKYVGKVNWLPGCKQYHIGSDKNNKFKSSFSKFMLKSLTENEFVLLLIGEIDTRHNEGIYANSIKYNINVKELIINTIDNYLSEITKYSNNKKLIIAGTAKPSTNRLKIIGLPLSYLKFIADFNLYLKIASLKKGFNYLDIYSHSCHYDNSFFKSDQLHFNSNSVCDNFQFLLRRPTEMPIIKIDNKEYDLDTLSDECKAQLASIQFVEQELARLQAQAAALQTAKGAYLQALQKSLPVIGGSDTIKLS